MERIRLGDTEIEVTKFALGCWPFAGGSVWGYQDDNISVATVHATLDAGINFFDTAEGYGDGHSEVVLGKALAGRREQAVIATKVSANHLAAADVVAACEQSLRNLQTDYIDLYQIHWPNRSIPLQETAEALAKLRGEGKVRAIGVSNFAVRDVSEFLSLSECVTDQLPYSLLWRVIEHEILPLCRKHQVGLICYSPLAQGLLTGRYASADDVPEGLARSRWYSSSRPAAGHGEPGCEAEVFTALEKIRALATEVGQPMAALALAWVRQQPGIASVLIGARSPDELALNLPAAELVLEPDVLQALDTITEPVKRALGANPDMWHAPSRMR